MQIVTTMMSTDNGNNNKTADNVINTADNENRSGDNDNKKSAYTNNKKADDDISKNAVVTTKRGQIMTESR
jgi:hypothetical protein